MSNSFTFGAHLEELSQIADRLFEALRLVNRLDEEVDEYTDFLRAGYAEQNWKEIPVLIRHVILSLIYATYLSTENIPDELLQWRRDIYAELDESPTKPRHLRVLK